MARDRGTRGVVRWSIGAVLLALSTQVAVADPAGEDWLKRIDAAERVQHSYSEITQTITTSSGRERILQMRSWTAEMGDVVLMAYTAPARVRGDKILMRDGGDHIWYYMRRRDVTRHFSGHTRRQKAMGSDFSYQDLAMGDMTEDYTATVVTIEELDTTQCVKLRCTPTETGPSYDHLILWAAVADSLSRRIEYYDDEGLLKTLHLSDFRLIDGRQMAMRMEMINDREGSRTVMKTESMNLSEEPDPALFTKRSLTRAAAGQ